MSNRLKITLKEINRLGSDYEVEYKFLWQEGAESFGPIYDEFINKIKTIGFIIERKGAVRRQEDTYFDDSSFSLHSKQCSLRAREMSGRAGNTRLTFKKRASVGQDYEDGLYVRIEDEAIITHDQKGRLFKGGMLNVFPVRLIQYVVPSCGKLNPVIRLCNKRKTIIIKDSLQRRAEVFFDEVVYFVGKREFGTHYEIEIKSSAMPRDDLKALIDFFGDRGLIPTSQSKYERGISLYRTAGSVCKHKKLVIIDTDCGVDDALALILALKAPELDIKAITTVSGNVHIDKVIPNVFKVFEVLKLDNPPLVARGADKPLKKIFEDVPSVHGQDGLGDVIPNPHSIKIDHRPAWQIICDMARQNPKEITLVTICPMTNLALAIQNDPEGVSNLKEVAAMGGVFFNTGNIRADAEFNVYSDPDAAKIAVDFCISSCRKIPIDKHGKEVTVPDNPTKEFYEETVAAYLDRNPKTDSKALPLTFVGLDVTHKVKLRRKFLQWLIYRNPNNKLLDFVSSITEKYMDFYEGNEGLPGCYLHDPLAVAYIINPALLEIRKHIIDVETRGQFTSGMIFPDDRPTRNPIWRNPANEVIGVAQNVEREAFEEFFIRRLLA